MNNNKKLDDLLHIPHDNNDINISSAPSSPRIDENTIILQKKCKLCSTKFGLLRRRYQCGKCNSIICKKCSSHRIGHDIRVCDECFLDLFQNNENNNRTSIINSFRTRVRGVEKTILSNINLTLNNEKKQRKKIIDELNTKLNNLSIGIKALKVKISNSPKNVNDIITPRSLSYDHQNNNNNNNNKTPLQISLENAQKRYKQCREQINAERLEYYFPEQASKYKMRLCVEDGVYIATQDIGVENICGNFELVARHGRIVLRIWNFKAVVQLYNFKLAGKKKLIKFLSSILSPSRVSVCVESKDLSIPLTYHVRDRCWNMDETAVFQLFVMKQIKGAATAPDAFVQWLANSLVPMVIKKAVYAGMPEEIGHFLRTRRNEIKIDGDFEIEGEFGEDVWHAYLNETTNNSIKARKLLHINIEQANKLCEITQTYHFNGFEKGVSLHLLYKYYQTYSVDKLRWIQLIDLWQVLMDHGLTIKNNDLWFINMFTHLEELGKKHINIKFHLQDVSLKLDLTDSVKMVCDLYIKAVHLAIEQESKLKANSTAKLLAQIDNNPFLRINEAKENVNAIQNIFKDVGNSIHQAVLSIVGKIKGGDDGTVILNLCDLNVDAILPQFIFTIPGSINRLPTIDVQTEINHMGHYIFTFHIHDPDFPEYTYQHNIYIAGLRLNLFTSNIPGGVSLCIDTVRFGGPLAALIDIPRFFTYNNNLNIKPPQMFKNKLLKSASMVQAPDVSVPITTPRIFELNRMNENIWSSVQELNLPTFDDTITTTTTTTSTTANSSTSNSTLGTPAKLPQTINISSSPSPSPLNLDQNIVIHDDDEVDGELVGLKSFQPIQQQQQQQHQRKESTSIVEIRDIFTVIMEYLTESKHALSVGFGVSVSIKKTEKSEISVSNSMNLLLSKSTTYDGLLQLSLEDQEKEDEEENNNIISTSNINNNNHNDISLTVPISRQRAISDASYKRPRMPSPKANQSDEHINNKNKSVEEKENNNNENEDKERVVIEVSTANDDECIDVGLRADIHSILFDVMSLMTQATDLQKNNNT